MNEPLYIIDGYSIIYKSYFAFIRNPLINSEGKNVSVIFGFFRSLLSIIKHRKVTNLVVVMDSKTPTFRHVMYKEYKANREKTPDDLHSQIPVVEEILEAFGIKCVREDGYEADDLIASFAKGFNKQNTSCFIVSGDKDLLQLVDGPVKMLKNDKGVFTELDRDKVFEDRGVYPEQIVDYLSLTGDQADNIPGIKGIGPKTAVKLLSNYKTLENLFENVAELKGSVKTKIEEGKEAAYLSKELVILKDDLIVDLDLNTYSIENINKLAAGQIFLREDVQNLAKELGATSLKVESSVPQKEQIKGKYETVLKKEDLQKWIELVKKSVYFAFDVETDSLDAVSAKPVGFSISVESGIACYIPLKADNTICLDESFLKESLKTILEDESLKCIGQNIKYDYKVLKSWGIEIKNIYFDTMIAAWIYDSQMNSYSMDNLAENFLNYKTVSFKDIVPKDQTFNNVPIEIASDYAAEDADITFRLFEYFSEKIKEAKLDKILFDLEMPLVRILGDMELCGVILETEELAVFSKELAVNLGKIEDGIFNLCNKVFNIKSTKQLQEVLFVDRKLNPIKKTKTGYSTDTGVLEELSREDPVPALILKHRMLSKLKSTYVDSLPQMINEQTGKIHSQFIQTGTATGRLSSQTPNLQNIPIKNEEGRKIRSAFVSGKGKSFVSADYSQIELVVLAHLSQDEELKTAFINNEDVHKRTGSLVFSITPEEVSSDQRRIAKIINFGVMYGMSAFRLSRELRIPRNKADEFIKSYFEKYSGIKGFIEKCAKEAEETSYIKTILGRRRRINGINSKNKTEKKGAQRVALNTSIQGTAADIVKLAMLRLNSVINTDFKTVKLLLQVHDELIFEVEDEEADKFAEVLKKEMESVIKLSVPLKVSVEKAKTWGDLH